MTSVQQAQKIHDIAFYLLPVVASVVLFTVAVVQGNTALYAVAAGALGIPGLHTATKALTSGV